MLLKKKIVIIYNFVDLKTIIAAVILCSLAIYQFSRGDYTGGTQTVFVAVAALGVKVTVDQNTKALQQIHVQQQQFVAMIRHHETDEKLK